MSPPKVGTQRMEHATLRQRMANGGPLPVKLKLARVPLRPEQTPVAPAGMMPNQPAGTPEPMPWRPLPVIAPRELLDGLQANAYITQLLDAARAAPDPNPGPQTEAPPPGPSNQGPAAVKAKPLFVNPALATVKSGCLKRYTVNGVSVSAPYRQLPRGPLAPNATEKRFVGSGHVNVVHTRRNPASTVSVKRSIHPVDADLVRARSQVLNSLVQCLAEPDAARFKDHFAPEVLKEIDATGRAVHYTPVVNGFSLQRYFKNPDYFRPIVSPKTLRSEVRRLQDAMEWLFSKGTVHGDPSPGNIMYDQSLGKLVLIDFELATRTLEEDDLNDDLQLIKRLVTTPLRSMPR